MNTLRPQEALLKLRTHAPLVELIARLEDGPYPVDIGEAEGPFAAVIVAQMAERARTARSSPRRSSSAKGAILVVVPTDQEAEALEGDLSFLGARPVLLPWWRTAAYRPASPRAHAFGERAACLSRLCLGDADVVVASQRAFVTPVPPRAAFAPLALLLEVGGSIDPTTVGDRLSSYGYLRVPRVSLPGNSLCEARCSTSSCPGTTRPSASYSSTT